jgi:hypothetical protein
MKSNAIFRLGFLPAVTGCLGTVPCDACPHLHATSARRVTTISANGTTPGLEIISTDISSQAMKHLDRRLDEIRTGRVRLNTTEDESWWDKNTSIPIYALDNSPLLRLFMHAKEVTQ